METETETGMSQTQSQSRVPTSSPSLPSRDPHSASGLLPGAERGDAAARNGFTAYNLVIGQGQGVVGDGFIPSSAALLDGATQLTLNCYHSGGSADPWPLDDWCTPLPEPPTARGPPWHA